MREKVHIAIGDYAYLVEDLVRSTSCALTQLGYEVSIRRNELHDTAIILNMGVTAFSVEELQQLGSRHIHFNIEQLTAGNLQITSPRFWNTLRIGYVWDYCQQNLAILHELPITYVPIGYVPPMTQIESALEQDIDVLFYGFETLRRQRCLQAIRDTGLNVVSTGASRPSDQPWKNDYRNQLIGRSKVVLNLHAEECNNVFEIIRVSWLLANKKCVVSEITPTTWIESDLRHAIVGGTIEQLPELCQILVMSGQNSVRQLMEQEGFRMFSQRNYIEYVAKGMADYKHWLATK